MQEKARAKQENARAEQAEASTKGDLAERQKAAVNQAKIQADLVEVQTREDEARTKQVEARVRQAKAEVEIEQAQWQREINARQAEAQAAQLRAQKEEAVNLRMKVENKREWIEWFKPTYLVAGIGAVATVLGVGYFLFDFVPGVYKDLTAPKPQSTRSPDVITMPDNHVEQLPLPKLNKITDFRTRLPIMSDEEIEFLHSADSERDWAGYNGVGLRFRNYFDNSIVVMKDSKTSTWYRLWPHPYPTEVHYRGLTFRYKSDGSITLEDSSMAPWKVRDHNPDYFLDSPRDIHSILTWSGPHRATFLIRKYDNHIEDVVDMIDLGTKKWYKLWPHPFPTESQIHGVTVIYKPDGSIYFEGRNIVSWRVQKSVPSLAPE